MGVKRRSEPRESAIDDEDDHEGQMDDVGDRRRPGIIGEGKVD